MMFGLELGDGSLFVVVTVLYMVECLSSIPGFCPLKASNMPLPQLRQPKLFLDIAKGPLAVMNIPCGKSLS